MSVVSAALLSLLSALLAAAFTHALGLRRKKRDELAEMRLRAYTDFLSSAARLASARRSGRTEDDLDDLASLNNAKVRICICGSPSVVTALTAFWAEGGTLELEGELLAFSRLCRSLREDLGNTEDDIREVDLPATLFRLHPSKYSYKTESESKKLGPPPSGDA